ncbi:hypothetical protein HGRIS_001749 [Hohenbuehelia grisea]|uniref:CFEM domain-containing protein n=1 Tax=Hohenbuehelia grisea TaxID=104357 RepID=A0ABR3JK35_9AGAR
MLLSRANLPICLVAWIQIYVSLAAAQQPTPTLVPPSTFPTVSVSSTTSSTNSITNSSSTIASSTSSAALPSLSGFSSCGTVLPTLLVNFITKLRFLVTNCFTLGIAAANCSNVVPVDCYCTKANFTSTLVSCVSAECPTELVTEQNLAGQFCRLASSSISLSFPTPSSSSTSSTASNSSSTATWPGTSAPTSQPPAQSSSNAAAGTAAFVSGSAFLPVGGLIATGLMFMAPFLL